MWRAGCINAEAEGAELIEVARDQTTLDSWLARREAGEPLQWITGRFRFCDRWYAIEAGVYVPRPQTEELARRAALLVPEGGRALDLCTGAGAIAAHLAAEAPPATVIGVDIDPLAVVCARRNGVPAVVGDLAEPIRHARVFDVITAVAPYVPTEAISLLPADVQRYEPRRALDGGADGTELVARIVSAAGRLLRPGGHLLLEIGGAQTESLVGPLAAAGFGDATPWFDEDGDLRGLVARAPNSGGRQRPVLGHPPEVGI